VETGLVTTGLVTGLADGLVDGGHETDDGERTTD
jgi:hypothetical protein